ncbi:MAG: ATP-binding protein [Crocinitomicaceae bacterium]
MRGNFSSEEGHIVKNNIREFDPFAARVLAEYCEQLIRKKQNRLNISESILLKSIEVEFANEEAVIERELAGVIRSAKRILEDTSETEWSDEHKQLFLLLKKIVFVGLEEDDETSDSDVINQVVDGLMRLDYSQEIPVFQVVDEERNIFNYIGYILGSLAEKFRESTVSTKAVNTYLSADPTKAFIVVDEKGNIRFVSQRLEKLLEQPKSELIDQSVFDIIPSWKGSTITEIEDGEIGNRALGSIDLGSEQMEAYIQLDSVILSDDQFSDDEDEVKEFVISVDFDLSNIDEDEEVYNNLTSIDSVIEAVKSLKKGNVSPSDHNYNLQTSLESLYRMKYAQLDKLNKVNEIQQEQIEPNTLVKSILSELRFSSGFDQVKFNVENTLKESFTGDFETVYTFLKHLMSNAVKYRNPKTSTEIQVIFSKKKKATVIEVVDDGIGMDKGILDKIFDKGFRGSKATEGYGLGLYFIRRCLKRCNGTISVESQLGLGSKFTITLNH